MGPARIYPWRKMHRSRAPSIAPGTFFVAQPWADCITNMPGFNLRQAQVDESPDQETTLAASEEFDNRRKTLSDALTMLNKRERRIFETRRLADARTKAMPFQGGTTKVARPALVTGQSEYTPAASSSPLRALWLQPTSRIASRIRTSRERADSQFGVASCVKKGGRATTERPMPQIKPMSAKRALRRRCPDGLLRLPLENLRMYGERKEWQTPPSRSAPRRRRESSI